MTDTSLEALRARVARFKDLQSSSEAFIDTRIPEYNREIYNIIGRGVTEDAKLKPAIEDNRDFNLTLMKSDPGKGSSQHDHQTIECFVALTGKWAITLGDNGEEAIILEPFDVFSVPPGVMRGVRNVGAEPAYILTILGGTDPGRAKWSQQINEKGRALGLHVDENGDMVRLK
ncbi:MAG: cupin domain-containing protein [Alphaproteobacteria bacterium]|nr:cupin domain-containing protein [Alphaproteobacteria bacterium]